MSDKPQAAIGMALSALLVFGSACSDSGGEGWTPSGGSCVSAYYVIARGASWQALKRAMLAFEDGRTPVTRVRVQERGHDLGYGDQDVVRVVDLLSRTGRRVLQLDVWRVEDGGWRAGEWGQCIDS